MIGMKCVSLRDAVKHHRSIKYTKLHSIYIQHIQATTDITYKNKYKIKNMYNQISCIVLQIFAVRVHKMPLS